MDLNAITKVVVEKLRNYSDRRVRVAWGEIDGAIGYDVYASYSQYESDIKVNASLITNNYFDIIPPESPQNKYYVWVIAEDSEGRRSNFAKRGFSWCMKDLIT